MKKLVDKNIVTALDLANLSPMDIERFLNKNPPAAMKIADTLRSFPRLTVDGHVAKAQGGDVVDHLGTGVNAVARVKFGCMNEGGVPRWRSRVPSVTFFAVTEEGTLLHIWRGKLQAQGNEVSFTVPLSDAETVHCHYTCDDIVGTMQSLQLPCINVPREELAVYHPPSSSTQNAGAVQTTVSILREPETRPAKRQRRLDYSTHPITVGDTVVDCVDLSAVDDTDGGPVQSTPRTNNHPPALMSGALSADSGDSFAFQSVSTSVSTRRPRHCRGGGTQQDPLTLDDSSSDDYDDTFDDTTIFDDIELPAIKESPTHKPAELTWRPSKAKRRASDARSVAKSEDGETPASRPLKRKPFKLIAPPQLPPPPPPPPPPAFNMNHIDTFFDDDNEVVLESEIGSPQPDDSCKHKVEAGIEHVDTSCDAARKHGVPENPPFERVPVAFELREVDARAEVDSRKVVIEKAPPSANGDKEMNAIEHETVNDAPEKEVEVPKEPTKEASTAEPSEPSWVSMSGSSIVDFLRGHVKFI